MVEPWDPANATLKIRQVANDDHFDLMFTEHAAERFQERSLILGDLLYVLKNGTVYEDGTRSTRLGYHKYKIQSRTPNSDLREIALIVVACEGDCCLKIVTVMWVDETSSVAGSILGGML